MNERYGDERYGNERHRNDRTGRNRSDMIRRDEDFDRESHGSRQQQQFRTEHEDDAFTSGRSSRQYSGSDNPRQMGGRYSSDTQYSYGSYPYEGSSDEDRYGSQRPNYGRDREEREMYHSSQGYSRNYPQAGSAPRPQSQSRYGAGARFGSFTGDDYGGRDFSGSGAGWSGSGGMSPTYGAASTGIYGEPTSYQTGRSDYASSRSGRYGHQSSGEYGNWRTYGEERGFLERAGDEIASWFGDEEAARRRQEDHRGRGPAGYTRSDERIREDVNDHLTRDWAVDASDITVTVSNGEVTLDGKVGSRIAKRRAEDCAEEVSGVRHVQNNLRIASVQERTGQSQTAGTATGSVTSTGTTGSGAQNKTGASTTTAR